MQKQGGGEAGESKDRSHAVRPTRRRRCWRLGDGGRAEEATMRGYGREYEATMAEWRNQVDSRVCEGKGEWATWGSRLRWARILMWVVEGACI